MDPIWHWSSHDEITFYDSYKMKLAVIIGISQMIFGVSLSGLNNLFFKQYVDFFFVFIPQIIFIVSIFG